ncbi:MAG: acetate--CoA ligase family protein, partial [Spirochaetota bacterium]
MSASISQHWQRETATLLEQVYAGGRTRLFEHEVYCILELLGLRVPAYLPVKDEREITADTLARFSTARIVLKALAPGLVHKQRAGGVRVVHKDLEFVRWSCRKMLDELSRQGVEPQGVLLVSFVEYSRDLGNEILLGFRESEAFGPVISFSKGGTDAEHFAANFSPPNLILPPINREWAAALQESTHIQKKYREEGSLDYADCIVEAEVLFSRLAVAFSSFFPGPGRVVLKEFEINPFVFDLDRRFIALDGYASLAGRESPPNLEVESLETMRPFFEPRGVAVVGVSDDPQKSGSIIAANLVNLGREDLYCVNIKGGAANIGGREVALYPSVEHVPGPVDLAVITVPAEATVEVVESCARKGVRAIILITGGFGEIRRHRDLEERILAVCRKAGMRLMGPNCLGILYPGEVNTFFIPEEKFRVSLERERNVAILS